VSFGPHQQLPQLLWAHHVLFEGMSALRFSVGWADENTERNRLNREWQLSHDGAGVQLHRQHMPFHLILATAAQSNQTRNARCRA
jgi:hypothetical protein